MTTDAISPAAISCDKCGKPNASHANFCAACGAPISGIGDSQIDRTASKIPDQSGSVYLKRAWGLIDSVRKATETFRERAIQHNEQVDQDQPFVSGLIGAFRGAGRLKQEKGSLVSDLDLAASEIEKAAGVNPDATLHTEEGEIGIVALRAGILYLRGQIEVIWGSSRAAKAMFLEALQIFESPDSHYMLGLLHEDEYKPQEALRHFERCLELDPDGELSVAALREANSMRKYRKRFRGNWLLCLGMLIFFFPAAIVYYLVKYK